MVEVRRGMGRLLSGFHGTHFTTSFYPGSCIKWATQADVDFHQPLLRVEDRINSL
jgi:hypothetical protein